MTLGTTLDSYVRSERWKLISETVLRREKRRCAVCKDDWRLRGDTLTTKHRNQALGHERPSDVCCLCSSHEEECADTARARRRYLLRKHALVLAVLGFFLLFSLFQPPTVVRSSPIRPQERSVNAR